MVDLFWELRQHARIGQVSTSAARAESRATEAMTRLVSAERRAEKALMICEALWCIVRAKLDLSDDELAQMVKQVDESDGKLDGKVRRPAKKCPSCTRTSPARVSQCIYCGAELEATPFTA